MANEINTGQKLIKISQKNTSFRLYIVTFFKMLYSFDERYITPAPGTYVSKVGASTGTTTARVYSNFGIATLNGETTKNLMMIENFSQGGDSGGLIYIDSSSTEVKAVGLILGGTSTYTYATKGADIPWTAWLENP